ncbi:MAG: hypothetical protein KC652_18365 [Cyanobacteria bacterium HKST-UBA01]|nr:hypothetical protein [Cyanobacteria bacterium HKST-UBA01]
MATVNNGIKQFLVPLEIKFNTSGAKFKIGDYILMASFSGSSTVRYQITSVNGRTITASYKHRSIKEIEYDAKNNREGHLTWDTI